MYVYKLTRIVFNDDTTIEPGNLTIIVGPNNSGKSRALKDVAALTTQSRPLDRPVPSIVVNEVEETLPQNLQEVLDAYNFRRHQDNNAIWMVRTLYPEFCSEYRMTSQKWQTIEAQYSRMESEQEKRLLFISEFGQGMMGFLTTENRLQLVQESPSPSHELEEANLLQALYYGRSPLEKSIREVVKRAFGQEIALDFTVPQRLRLRVGNDFRELPTDPRDTAPILAQYEKLDEQGDGIRGFVGIVTAILVSKRSVFLIDEPETFLHPPHAFRIGEFLAAQANTSRQIIIATHSADVLRGILSKTQDVAILRIDRTGNTNSFRLLDPNRLKELVTDPLLSSARVLDGLFYAGAVVVEADSDARFYHAASNKRRGDVDLHFVNADNKQTVPLITKMYHDMGVRCVGIVDFDVLNKHEEFIKQLEALALGSKETEEAVAIRNTIALTAKETPPDGRLNDVEQQLDKLLVSIRELRGRNFESEQEAISTKEKLLGQIERKCQEVAASSKAWKPFKEKGQAALPANLQGQFDRLWRICAAKGLFINPCGELESMLAEYGIPHTTDKRSWVTQALQLLPELQINDEKHPWKFIQAIRDHLLGDTPK